MIQFTLFIISPQDDIAIILLMIKMRVTWAKGPKAEALRKQTKTFQIKQIYNFNILILDNSFSLAAVNLLLVVNLIFFFFSFYCHRLKGIFRLKRIVGTGKVKWNKEKKNYNLFTESESGLWDSEIWINWFHLLCYL